MLFKLFQSLVRTAQEAALFEPAKLLKDIDEKIEHLGLSIQDHFHVRGLQSTILVGKYMTDILRELEWTSKSRTYLQKNAHLAFCDIVGF